LYYPSDSLKAKFCVRGKELLYDYCRERSVDHSRCGKLVVASDEEQFRTILPRLQDDALKNGVADTKILRGDDVAAMEPSAKCRGALWSPSTGIVDSHGYMVSLLGDAEANGATLALHTKVVDARIDNDGKILLCCSSSSYGDNLNGRPDQEEDTMWLSCKHVVNCSGLWADRVAAMIHSSITGNDVWSPPKQYFARGSYFRLHGVKSPFSRLVYPVPDPNGGLGVHATIDMAGQTKFGPDVEWLPVDTDPDEIEYAVDPCRALSFYESIRRYWPDLPDDSLVPDYTGVRPKLSHPTLAGLSGSFRDFAVVGPSVHGIPGLVHLFGIESPGLTSSLAIGEYVAAEVTSTAR